MEVLFNLIKLEKYENVANYVEYFELFTLYPATEELRNHKQTFTELLLNHAKTAELTMLVIDALMKHEQEHPQLKSHQSAPGAVLFAPAPDVLSLLIAAAKKNVLKFDSCVLENGQEKFSFITKC